MFPVEEKIPEIRRALAANRPVVLTAPPGSGKTTCVPPALLDEPWLAGKKIVVLEPRRLAARNCAQYIAGKRGEAVGGTVGYQVRLERKVSSRTRLEIVTEGLLAQRILSDPELNDVGLVIFDEFHERALPCDLAFALTLDVRRALRPDIRICVMSATLDADAVSRHLDSVVGPTSVVRAEGRMYPVETRFLGDCPMTAAVERALKETAGDVLCFLPGEGEIRRAQSALESMRAHSQVFINVRILPLYGALPKEDQDRVFERSPFGVRKVILATSIAETSVTVEGVTAVVDSGLMRVPRFSPATGMTALVTLPLTRDRAEQRRGRAGRVCAGVCYRLWTEADESSRPAKAAPEILDADLASLVLSSASWGALSRLDLPWMTPPPDSSWEQARNLLRLLGAFDARGQLTDSGRELARAGLHPRLANMCRRAATAGSLETAAILAAIIEEGTKSCETDIRRVLDEICETPNRPDSHRILALARRFASSFGGRPLPDAGRTPHSACFAARFARGIPGIGPYRTDEHYTPLSEGSLLALAYPDRIARNRGNGTFQMVSGRGAFLPREDGLARAAYLVCCELDDRVGDAKVFLASPIDEAEIEELFGSQIVEEPYCEWDRANDRVKSVIVRRLGKMKMGEKGERVEGVEKVERVEKVEVVGADPRAARVERVERGDGIERGERICRAMMEGIRLKGVENLPCWTKESRQLRARLSFLSRVLSWPAPTDEAILAALPGFIGGLTKWRDLERLDLFSVFDYLLSEAGHDRRELDRLAPMRMEVPSGSHMLIHYEGEEPTCEVRLQECFGLMETPKVAGGRIPVVMTLLSPAQRPVQITKDLAGFWRGAYQLVRKDMRGRYPKHYWPEDPFTAVATRRVRPRLSDKTSQVGK